MRIGKGNIIRTPTINPVFILKKNIISVSLC